MGCRCRAAAPRELLLGETFISRERTSGTYQSGKAILERLGVSITELRTAIEVRSSESVKQMVSEGLGIGLISLSAARDYAQFGKVLAFPFEDETLRRRLYIVKHKNSILSPIAQVFYDYARKYYTEGKETKRDEKESADLLNANKEASEIERA